MDGLIEILFAYYVNENFLGSGKRSYISCENLKSLWFRYFFHDYWLTLPGFPLAVIFLKITCTDVINWPV